MFIKEGNEWNNDQHSDSEKTAWLILELTALRWYMGGL